MIISILNEKGGVGKTTLAVNIAFALKQRGFDTLLVDSDPQGSAREWHVRNGGELVDMVALDRNTIAKDIQPFKKNYSHIVIDGAGWGCMSSPSIEMAVKTIMCSDYVIIPLQPSPFDLHASSNIAELVTVRQQITEYKLKSAFVLTQCVNNANITQTISEELSEFKIPLLRTKIMKRVAYAESAMKGNSVLQSGDTKAILEINQLVDEILCAI